jgi:hypothetical protein
MVHIGKAVHQPLPETVRDKITARLSKCILDLIHKPDYIWLKTYYLAFINGTRKIACITMETTYYFYCCAISALDIEVVGFWW